MNNHNKIVSSKDYLYFSRKGQITISFLLIFFILFSVFAVGIFASREMWASAKFKGAVDAAALSAGADMARGADLIITLTGIRLALFGISMLLYIISIPVPEIFPVADSVNTLSKKVSKILSTFSRYVPGVYTLKAEIDAYRIFIKNFSLRDQGINKWTFNDYGIVVIPNYLIKKIPTLFNGKVSASSLQQAFLPTNLEDSITMLQQGVSVFGYRKLSYLERVKKNLGISTEYSSIGGVGTLEKWLNEHEYIVSSAKISKTETDKTETDKKPCSGVDLSDALKISDFLSKWDSSESNALRDKASSNAKNTQINDTLEKVLNEADSVVQSVSDNIAQAIYLVDSGDCNSSFPNKSVCKAKDIIDKKIPNLTNDGYDCNSSCINKINAWINFCKQNNRGAGEDFAADIAYMHSESIGLEDDIKNYRNLLNTWKNGDKDPPALNNLKDTITSIEDYAHDDMDILSSELNNLPDYCYCTKKTLDKNGKIHYEPKKVSLKPAKTPMNSLYDDLNNIYTTCGNVKKEIELVNKKFDNTTESDFKESQGTLKDWLKSLGDISTAFKGFPGGNLIACIIKPGDYNECISISISSCDFKKLDCKCVDCNSKTLFLFAKKIICAAKNDIALLQELFHGDKIEFASYYSAKLENPPFINPVAQIKDINNKNVGKLINNISDKTIDNIADSINSKVSNGLTFKDDDGKPESPPSVSSIALSIGGSIISGILSGGMSVAIGIVMAIFAKIVVNKLITDKIQNSLLPMLKNQVKHWADEISTTPVGKEASEALSKFIDIYNIISTTGLRLLGDNSQINSSSTLSLNFMFSRVAPDIKMGKLHYEETCSLS